MKIIKAETLYHHAFCVYLRTLVFIQEQGYDLHEEIYHDEDDATYFLALRKSDTTPLATGRYRILDGGTAQLERVCVAKEHRGKGYAAAIVEAIINDAQKSGAEKIFALIKEETFGLYERFGFEMLNEHYSFTGIPHCKIERPLG